MHAWSVLRGSGLDLPAGFLLVGNGTDAAIQEDYLFIVSHA